MVQCFLFIMGPYANGRLCSKVRKKKNAHGQNVKNPLNTYEIENVYFTSSTIDSKSYTNYSLRTTKPQ